MSCSNVWYHFSLIHLVTKVKLTRFFHSPSTIVVNSTVLCTVHACNWQLHTFSWTCLIYHRGWQICSSGDWSTMRLLTSLRGISVVVWSSCLWPHFIIWLRWLVTLRVNWPFYSMYLAVALLLSCRFIMAFSCITNEQFSREAQFANFRQKASQKCFKSQSS